MCDVRVFHISAGALMTDYGNKPTSAKTSDTLYVHVVMIACCMYTLIKRTCLDNDVTIRACIEV